VLETVAISNLGYPDCPPDGLDFAKVVAAIVDQQIELCAAYTKGIHFSIILAEHSKIPLKVTIGSLAAEPKVLSQELGLDGVIACTRSQAYAEYAFHNNPLCLCIRPALPIWLWSQQARRIYATANPWYNYSMT
jgi:hypothetical protein